MCAEICVWLAALVECTRLPSGEAETFAAGAQDLPPFCVDNSTAPMADAELLDTDNVDRGSQLVVGCAIRLGP